MPSPNATKPPSNSLHGVAAISASDVWAVGRSFAGFASHTLIEHWDGTQWRIVSSPNPGPAGSTRSDHLWAVAGVSTSDVWAVGDYFMPGTSQPLIEHWNGSKWNLASSPTINGTFFGVAAISMSNVWAVGVYVNSGGSDRTLIEHWNGTQWSIIPSPNAGSDSELQAVAVVSPNNIWAVGYFFKTGSDFQTLIEHWNGSKWSIVSSPSPGLLNGVTAISANNVWAVGDATGTLIEHWDGAQWRIVSSPSPRADFLVLLGATASSASDVWTVGYYLSPSGHYQALTEHWNGTQWSIIPSSGPYLHAVARVPATTEFWAVGEALSPVSGVITFTEYYC